MSSKAKTAPVSSVTEASTATAGDPFIVLSMTFYKLKEYPEPVTFENQQYIVTWKLWPGFLLLTDAKWSSIETEHGVAGTLLTAFKEALAREFPDQEESMRRVMRRIVETFKDVADTVIHFDSARGAMALLRRLKPAMASAKVDMTSLLAARLEGEHGAQAATQLRHHHQSCHPAVRACGSLQTARRRAHTTRRCGRRSVGDTA